jgi:hypothetical protein
MAANYALQRRDDHYDRENLANPSSHRHKFDGLPSEYRQAICRTSQTQTTPEAT